MIAARISITLGGNLFFFILLALLAMGAGYFFYRFTLPPLPIQLRIILASLRSASLVILLFILFEPVFQHIRTEEQLPSVAVLVDDSRSIMIQDKPGPRSELVQQLLRENPLGVVEPNIKVKYYTFAAKLKETTRNISDSLRFDGDETNIADAFAGLKERLQRENIQAVVIISDGNYTAGKNPIYDAEAFGVPFSTIGVGDTAEQKDILIAKVLTNDLVYADTRVPVDVTIKSSGYNGDKVEVLLLEGKTVIDRTTLTLNMVAHEYPIQFSLEPKEEGIKKLTVQVSHLPGEITEQNNARTVFLRVLRSKLQIILVAGEPSPDVAAVRQALSEDRQFTVHSFIQKNPGEFYEGAFTQLLLDSADCIAFIGYPTAVSNNTSLEMLKETIDRAKKPLFFINGKNISYQRLVSFGAHVPFTSTAVNAGEIFVSPAIIDQQKMHPLITLGGEYTADSWHQLPPIYKCQTIFHAKPEAIILAAVKLQPSILNEPLVVIRNVNRQKSFAITGQGIWRWQLLAQGRSQTRQFLPLLVSNAIRWLTTRDEEKNVQVISTKEIFTTAEPIEFAGQVYDEQLKPVTDAELTVVIKRGDGSFSVVLNSIGNGRYEGTFNGIGEGDYAYTATAMSGGKSYGTDKGTFTVGKTNIEFLETKMNKSLLEQLAYRTGGKYYDLSAAGRIGEELSEEGRFTSKEIIHRGEIELWNWKYLAGLIIVFLGVEWFLRKRNGML
jgi:hypothetical protein